MIKTIHYTVQIQMITFISKRTLRHVGRASDALATGDAFPTDEMLLCDTEIAWERPARL